jgi:hypothetical protein
MNMVKDMKPYTTKVFIDDSACNFSLINLYLFIIDSFISTTDEKDKCKKEGISFHFMEFLLINEPDIKVKIKT